MTKYKTTDEKFAAFLAEIDRLAVKDGAMGDGESYVEQTGEDCWREMYDDDLTAEDAWGEEVDAARSMM